MASNNIRFNSVNTGQTFGNPGAIFDRAFKSFSGGINTISGALKGLQAEQVKNEKDATAEAVARIKGITNQDDLDSTLAAINASDGLTGNLAGIDKTSLLNAATAQRQNLFKLQDDALAREDARLNKIDKEIGRTEAAKVRQDNDETNRLIKVLEGASTAAEVDALRNNTPNNFNDAAKLQALFDARRNAVKARNLTKNQDALDSSIQNILGNNELQGTDSETFIQLFSRNAKIKENVSNLLTSKGSNGKFLVPADQRAGLQKQLLASLNAGDIALAKNLLKDFPPDGVTGFRDTDAFKREGVSLGISRSALNQIAKESESFSGQDIFKQANVAQAAADTSRNNQVADLLAIEKAKESLPSTVRNLIEKLFNPTTGTLNLNSSAQANATNALAIANEAGFAPAELIRAFQASVEDDKDFDEAKFVNALNVLVNPTSTRDLKKLKVSSFGTISSK